MVSQIFDNINHESSMLALASCSCAVGPRPSRLSSPSLLDGRHPAARAAPFGPSDPATSPFAMRPRFKAWPALNEQQLALAVDVGRRRRLYPSEGLNQLFCDDALQARLGRELAERRAIDRKEFFETTEFFAQVRSNLRPSAEMSAAGAGAVIDVAGGHGLLAVLFSMFESRRYQRVLVLDTVCSSLNKSVLAHSY